MPASGERCSAVDEPRIEELADSRGGSVRASHANRREHVVKCFDEPVGVRALEDHRRANLEDIAASSRRPHKDSSISQSIDDAARGLRRPRARLSVRDHVDAEEQSSPSDIADGFVGAGELFEPRTEVRADVRDAL